MVRPCLALALAIVVLATATSSAADDGAANASKAPSDQASGKTSLSASRASLRYALEGIELLGNTRTASRVILRYVRFREGDILDVNDPELTLTRYRLLGTGFFSSVQLSLRRGSRHGSAVLVIEVTERNTFVIQNLWLGIAGDEDTAGNARPRSAFVGLMAAETNLAGTGTSLGGGVGFAAEQLALRLVFETPALAGTGWSVLASALYNDARDFFGNRAVSFESPSMESHTGTDDAVVTYKRAGATLGTGHDLGVSSQFSLDYHLERILATVPTGASHLRGDRREPIDFLILPGKSVVSSLRATVSYDTRDTPILTTRGTLALATVTVGVLPFGSDYSFQRIELSAQRWLRLPWQHVIRASAFAGGIAGDAPFFEKFYVGDFTDLLPDRVLDLAPDRRQPLNLFGTDIIEVRYGDFAARLEGEYRIPIYAGRSAVYAIDVFGSGGVYAVASRREFTDPPSGYTGLRRLPVDITYNLGVRVDTSIGGATVAFSNLLGLFPSRRGGKP
jgi:outer membrane protein insertion porin family